MDDKGSLTWLEARHDDLRLANLGRIRRLPVRHPLPVEPHLRRRIGGIGGIRGTRGIRIRGRVGGSPGEGCTCSGGSAVAPPQRGSSKQSASVQCSLSPLASVQPLSP
eukprot:7336457-Pyramimonas_sp.AAC.1